MARVILIGVLMAWAWPAFADLPSLFSAENTARPSLLTPATALVALEEKGNAGKQGASLFAGPQTGMFAPVAPRLPAVNASAGQFAPNPPRPGPTRAAHLLALIARAEAGAAGYDAVQHGARIKPIAPPTRMSLGQIEAWIEATPGQPHAIGRYQFIPTTLRQVVRQAGYGPKTRFTPEVQDRLAMVLLQDAGLSAFEAGTLNRNAFMKNLARIWAGLPLPSGKSFYHGHAGNKATMSWAAFSAGMARIWPIQG